MPELSHSAGARVVIHDQDGVSFPDEEGMNALPGVSTSIGVRRVCDKPHATCRCQLFEVQSVDY